MFSARGSQLLKVNKWGNKRCEKEKEFVAKTKERNWDKTRRMDLKRNTNKTKKTKWHKDDLLWWWSSKNIHTDFSMRNLWGLNCHHQNVKIFVTTLTFLNDNNNNIL